MDGLAIWIEARLGEILQLRGGPLWVLGALYVRTAKSRRKQGVTEQAEVHSQIVRRRIGPDYGRIGTECLSLSEVTTDKAAKKPHLQGNPMELGGFEPPTSWVRSRRSAN
jgi:hypothetical protein